MGDNAAKLSEDIGAAPGEKEKLINNCRAPSNECGKIAYIAPLSDLQSSITQYTTEQCRLHVLTMPRKPKNITTVTTSPVFFNKL